MQRRAFIAAFAPLAIVAVAVAKEGGKKADRLSGYVDSVDKSTQTIQMRMHSSPNVKRKIMYDDKTQILNLGKPGTADDIKDNMRIVAIGTFEGTDLKATKISLTAK